MADQEAQDWKRIKTAALDFLFGAPDDDAKRTVQKFVETLEKKIDDAAAADRQIDEIVTKLRGAPLEKVETELQKFAKLFGSATQSPPFYFFFGCIMILAALVFTEFRFNSSLTFLVAMLGVAILLYGTGSQAAGSFGNNPPVPAAVSQPDAQEGDVPNLSTPAKSGIPQISGPWNVAIAGGAAVLSAFFGWAVLTYAPEIRQVFRDDDQYSVVKVNFCDSSVSACLEKDSDGKTQTVGAVTSLIPEDTMRKVVSGAYLETSFGHRAYARQSGTTLEFVVFDRDLADGGEVRLIASASENEDRSYSVDGTFFDLQTKTRCMAPTDGVVEDKEATITNCVSGIYRLTRTPTDQQRIRWLVLRALVRQDPPKRTAQNGTIDDRTPVDPVLPQ